MKASMPVNVRKPIINAVEELIFYITLSHIMVAKCKDPSKCVVARALIDGASEHIYGIEVGTCVTLIEYEKEIRRYSTPYSLSKELPIFDRTKLWGLPEGTYALEMYKGRNRFHLIGKTKAAIGRKKNGDTRIGKRVMFTVRAAATRRLSSVRGKKRLVAIN